MGTTKNLVTVSEAASLLGVSRQRVLNLITAGQLEAEKLGAYYVLQADSVNRFAAKDRKPGRPPRQDRELKKKRRPSKAQASK